MTQQNLEEITRAQIYEQVRKDLQGKHLGLLFELAQKAGGMDELANLLFYVNQGLRSQHEECALTPQEILRAIKREKKIKLHYLGKLYKTPGYQKRGRGGRRNRVAEIVDKIQDMSKNFPNRPDLVEMRLRMSAKYYGGYAPPETRISLTSQWRVNKRLKGLGLPSVPWQEVRGVFTEEELERESMKRERQRRQREEEAILHKK